MESSFLFRFMRVYSCCAYIFSSVETSLLPIFENIVFVEGGRILNQVVIISQLQKWNICDGM